MNSFSNSAIASCKDAAADMFNSTFSLESPEDDAALDAFEDDEDELLLLHPAAPSIRHNARVKILNFFFIINVSPL